jgi:GNAT superfamily N-acetyltransferase
MDFTIRPARAEDAGGLSVIIRGLGLFDRLKSEDSEVTAARVAKHLDMCLSDDSHSLFVATDESEDLLGYAAVHWLPYLILSGPEGYVSELFVAPAARDCGVGTELLDTVAGEARLRGCGRLMLEAVRTRESYTRGFYMKRGWIQRDDMANMVFEL